MVREPHQSLTASNSSAAGLTRGSGMPYGKPTTALASSQQAVSTAMTASRVNHVPRLTIHNFSTFHARQKKLPPDANIKVALNTKLWQFPERVCFSCVKCRRDNIESDSVAVDLVNEIILCTACFTRIIRPRTYRPTRVVPFPSLLSWLNYKPSKVMKVSEDVLSRPADAVAPSGERMAVPTISGGDQPFNIHKLPVIAMNIVPASSTTSKGSKATTAGGSTGLVKQTSVTDGIDKHPCLRLWGICEHGGTCLFRNAPSDLCLAYLMGLCKGAEVSEIASSNNAKLTKCTLLHQAIYDLPNPMNPAPTERYRGDLEDQESPWAQWIRGRRNSLNSAEWQLWNNGPLEQLFDFYVPLTCRAEEGVGEKNKGSENGAADIKLNFSDIMSALRDIS